MPTIMFQVYTTQSPCFGDKNQSSIIREQLKSPQFKQSLNRYSIGERNDHTTFNILELYVMIII